MSIELSEVAGGKYMEVQVTGKLNHETYQLLIPATEAQIEKHGAIRILFVMHEFHGWDARALWDDLKFDVKHFNDFERIAIVGDLKWEHGLAMFWKTLTTASVRYFEEGDIEKARAWLAEE